MLRHTLVEPTAPADAPPCLRAQARKKQVRDVNGSTVVSRGDLKVRCTHKWFGSGTVDLIICHDNSKVCLAGLDSNVDADFVLIGALGPLASSVSQRLRTCPFWAPFRLAGHVGRIQHPSSIPPCNRELHTCESCMPVRATHL